MTNTNDMPQLLPCPFCGGTAELNAYVEQDGDFAEGCAMCAQCQAEGPVITCMAVGLSLSPGIDAEAAAISAWNNRQSQQAQGEAEAEAVQHFVNSMIGAFECGFIDSNTLTLATIYQVMRNHCKDGFGIEVEPLVVAWGETTARECAAPPAPAAVPDEAFNIIEGIRAELTWPGWRSARSRDWVMDMVSELLSMLTASPARGHSGDGNEIPGWISVNEQTPIQGERVLLKIDLEDCPVVGYWGCGRYEACTVNMEVSCGAFCYGGDVDGSFNDDEVTHWMPLPNPPQQEEAER